MGPTVAGQRAPRRPARGGRSGSLTVLRPVQGSGSPVRIAMLFLPELVLPC